MPSKKQFRLLRKAGFKADLIKRMSPAQIDKFSAISARAAKQKKLPPQPAGWITPDLEDHSVGEVGAHYYWAQKHFNLPKGSHDSRVYGMAFDAGYVRYRVSGNYLDVEGKKDNVAKTSDVWGKYAKNRHVLIQHVDDRPAWKQQDEVDKSTPNKKWLDMIRKRKQFESVQLNELKEYLGNDSEYGGWITSDKKVHPVGDYGHTRWVVDNYETDKYGDAFNDGCVRYQIDYNRNELNIQGKLESFKNTFFIWWPTVVKSDRINFDILDDRSRVIRGTAEKAELRAMFRKPKSKNHEPVIAPQGGKWWHQDKGRKVESKQINELREYLRQEEEYGGWITPDKKVHIVAFQKHGDWLRQNYEGNSTSYKSAWENNLVRYQIEEGSYRSGLNIEGKLSDIQNTFFIWWPTATQLPTLYVEITEEDTNRRYEESLDFNMENGEQKAKAREMFKPRRANPVTEDDDGFRSNIPPEKKHDPMGGTYSVSIYKHTVNRDNRNKDWRERVEKVKVVASGIKRGSAQAVQRQLIDRLSKRADLPDFGKQTKDGWVDYFTRMEQDDLDETEGGTVGMMFRGGYDAGMKSTAKNTKKRKKLSPLGNGKVNEKYNTNSTWLKVGKNIVEVMLNKVTRRIKRGDKITEEEIATYKIFVDGVDVGYVDNIDKVYLVKNDKTFDRYDNLEEAISKVMGPSYYDGKGTTEFVEFNPDPYSMNV